MHETKEYERAALMMEEVELLRETLTSMHCLENDLDINNSSDYSKAAIAVAEYIDPVTYDGIREIENLIENGHGDASAYGFSLKNVWRSVRKVRDKYVDKLSDKWEKARDWAGEKKEKAEELKVKTEDGTAMAAFFMKIRSANGQYKSCLAGRESKISEVCSKETGSRRAKCERKVGEKWDGKCSDQAMRVIPDAIKEVKSRAGSKELKEGIGFLNLYKDADFEEFLDELKDLVRGEFPEYSKYLRYL